MCRKLETESEKVLPFYASSLTPDEEEDVAAAVQEAPSEPLAEVHTSLPTTWLLFESMLPDCWQFAQKSILICVY